MNYSAPAIFSESVLAFTGMGIEWLILAGFALLAGGMAVNRIVPKRKKTTNQFKSG